jgi:hypothetical protein
MADVGLLPFARIALQVSRAVLPRYRSRLSKHQFTQPQLLAILCLMRYEDWIFREAEVRLSEHRELRQALRLVSVPDFTTLHRFLQRFGRPDHRPRGRRDGAPVARRTQKSTAASLRSRRCDGLGARERSAHSSSRGCISTGKNRCRGDIG